MGGRSAPRGLVLAVDAECLVLQRHRPPQPPQGDNPEGLGRARLPGRNRGKAVAPHGGFVMPDVRPVPGPPELPPSRALPVQ
eukprot:7619714-Alexandrium_andersonii.AAC.1